MYIIFNPHTHCLAPPSLSPSLPLSLFLLFFSFLSLSLEHFFSCLFSSLSFFLSLTHSLPLSLSVFLFLSFNCVYLRVFDLPPCLHTNRPHPSPKHTPMHTRQIRPLELKLQPLQEQKVLFEKDKIRGDTVMAEIGIFLSNFRLFCLVVTIHICNQSPKKSFRRGMRLQFTRICRI